MYVCVSYVRESVGPSSPPLVIEQNRINKHCDQKTHYQSQLYRKQHIGETAFQYQRRPRGTHVPKREESWTNGSGRSGTRNPDPGPPMCRWSYHVARLISPRKLDAHFDQIQPKPFPRFCMLFNAAAVPNIRQQIFDAFFKHTPPRASPPSRRARRRENVSIIYNARNDYVCSFSIRLCRRFVAFYFTRVLQRHRKNHTHTRAHARILRYDTNRIDCALL